MVRIDSSIFFLSFIFPLLCPRVVRDAFQVLYSFLSLFPSGHTGIISGLDPPVIA